METDYRTVLGAVHGKRRGITTGTCAQAAALAAATGFLSGAVPEEVTVTLPASRKAWSGVPITIPVHEGESGEGWFRATVIKDSGDDADVTDGLPICVTVRLRDEPGILIRGGRGVGTVRKYGLPVPPGHPAINPVPRSMIEQALAPLVRHGCGFDVLVEAPGGEERAARTWNPRIGVEGGISIIGTSGVVEPSSSEAFRKSLRRTAKAFRVRGLRDIALTPGYVGENYLRAAGVADDSILVIGDHVGFCLDLCARLRFRSVLLVAHVGKLAKVAAGIFNTHCKYGDARLETLAAHAGAAGAPPELIARILELGLAEEAVPILQGSGFAEAFSRIARAAAVRSALRMEVSLREKAISGHNRDGLRVPGITCVALSLDGTELGRWSPSGKERSIGDMSVKGERV